MRKLLSLLIAAAFLVSQANGVLAQSLAIPLGGPADAIDGAYAAGKATELCLRHKFLCAAAIAVGVGVVHHEAKKEAALDAATPSCSEEFAPLYRAVGRLERAEIATIQRYVILPTGIGVKQFMLSFADAKWIASFNQQFESTPNKEMFIVTSKVCAGTLAQAEQFTDAGHLVASFRPDALEFVNLDAARWYSGDLDLLWSVTMSTYSIEFLADVGMVGDDPHPPALTTIARPNLVVGDSYCLCYVTETTPAEGIVLRSEGSFKAVAVCSENVLDLFASGAPFELRAASRVFGKGTFRQIFSRTKNAPNAA